VRSDGTSTVFRSHCAVRKVMCLYNVTIVVLSEIMCVAPHHLRKQDFVRAGSTLDASAKIYATRVDAVRIWTTAPFPFHRKAGQSPMQRTSAAASGASFRE
jgi:hypothetical protein